MSDGYETRFTENDSKSLLLLNLVLVGVQREKLLHLKPESVELTLLKSLDLILALQACLCSLKKKKKKPSLVLRCQEASEKVVRFFFF